MPGTPEVLTWSGPTSQPGPSGARAAESAWVELGELGGPDDPAGASPSPTPAVRRVPRAVVWVAGLLAAGGLVLSAVRSPGDPTPAAASTASTDSTGSTGSVGGEDPDFTLPPLPRRLDLPAQVALAASSTAVLHDVVRTGASKGECPPVGKGHTDPVRATMRVVHRVLPGYRLLDAARTSDGFGGICLVQLRAEDADSTVLVVNIVPPGVWPGGGDQDVQSLESATEGSSLVRTVSDRTATGWRVDVGAVGAQPVVPDLGRLGELAGGRGLEW
jgi:hypothetical protein